MSTQTDQRWATRLQEMAVQQQPLLSKAGMRQQLRNAYLAVRGSIISAPEKPFLHCLYLHSVYDDRREPFRRMLSELRSSGRFVDAAEALEIVNGNRALEGPCFHLSLDDGFDNNYRNAFPILEEFGIKATFFVPSRLIDTTDAEFLDAWWTRGIDPLPTRMMRWSWLREMADHGHEIGSHTRTHARLSDISGDSERLVAEVEGSKRDIEDALGKPCRFISWPYGTFADMDERAFAEIEIAGYEGCFSAVRGFVEPGTTSRFAIPRDQAESSWPISHVRYFALTRGAHMPIHGTTA
jgi:peptidoglycan/xylan/chitin deacetylase (PgdA/CDA1 family)